MSRTWPKMFQRQVRVMVADCLVCASVYLFKPNGPVGGQQQQPVDLWGIY
jgi:hypothetical protein